MFRSLHSLVCVSVSDLATVKRMKRSQRSLVFLVLAGSLAGCSGSSSSPVPFDRTAWLEGERADFSAEAPRLRMADHLVSSRALLGKNRPEIEAMLGPDTNTDKFRSYDLVYWLGAQRNYMPIDSEWLVLRFDKSGRVSEARIVYD